MNKILILTSALAMAFVMGCSEDEASSTYSCDMVTSYEMAGQTISSHVCVETAASNVTEEEKATCSTEQGSEGSVLTLGTGCASGAALSCTTTHDGQSGTTHFYGDEFKGKTCDQVMGSDDEEESAVEE